MLVTDILIMLAFASSVIAAKKGCDNGAYASGEWKTDHQDEGGCQWSLCKDGRWSKGLFCTTDCRDSSYPNPKDNTCVDKSEVPN
jgi:hypothetical protein